jgi:hypothetical protein
MFVPWTDCPNFSLSGTKELSLGHECRMMMMIIIIIIMSPSKSSWTTTGSEEYNGTNGRIRIPDALRSHVINCPQKRNFSEVQGSSRNETGRNS